jgi:ribonuclease HI
MGRKNRPGGQTKFKTSEASSTNPCRLCGKRFAVSTGRQISRAAILRLAKRADVCSSCWLSEEAALAAPKAAALGLPELVGTPRQKQFALIVRQQHVDAELPLLPSDEARKEFLAQISSQTEVKCWIENRKRTRAQPSTSTRPPFDPAHITEPIVHFDGGCTRNPGGVGTYGAILKIGGQIKDAVCGRIGRGETSNRAEYRGLIEGLKLALKHLQPGSTVLVAGDSKLVIRQMRKDWRVLNDGLRPLWQEAKNLEAQVGKVTYYHVSRTMNRDADRLARAGLNPDKDAMAVLLKRPSPPPAKVQTTPGSQIQGPVVAIAAAGQGSRMAAGAVVRVGDADLASLSSTRGRDQKFSTVLRLLAQEALHALARQKPEGGPVTILTVEQSLLCDPRAWPAGSPLCAGRRSARMPSSAGPRPWRAERPMQSKWRISPQRPRPSLKPRRTGRRLSRPPRKR